MFGSFSSAPANSADIDRINHWTRQRFSLGHSAAVLVAELECAQPGCPPLETVVAFWTDDANGRPQRHHFKVFKPVAQVAEDDLPYAWMKPGLVVPEGQGCECC